MLLPELVTSTPEVTTEDVSGASTIYEPEDGGLRAPIWKGKGSAIHSPSDSAVALPDMLNDIDEDDWMKFEPPEGLKTAPPGVDSDVILQVIQDSIDRIKAKIAENEERQKAETEAAARPNEEGEAERANEEDKKPDIPRVSVDTVDEPVRPPSPNRNPYAYAMSKKTLRIGPHGLLAPVIEPKSKKRSLFALLKRLNHGSEKGETSAAGAARHGHTRSSNSRDLSGRTRSALDAIKKVTGSSSSSSPKSSVDEDVIVECVSCLDDFSARDTIRAPCHHYCMGCFRRLVATACEHEQQWPPKCCLNAIPESTVIAGLTDLDEDDAPLLRDWQARRAEWNIPVADRVYCGWRECGLWCRPEHVDAARGEARCPADHWTCVICRGQQHEGSQCPQDRDLLRTNELAEEEGWQRCYGCGAYVEHREACQHMTCRCGAEFCYVCGGRWRTCLCTMEQLEAVKRDASDRRTARAERDAVEEAELAEALRLVAEFEREEALKAELLRQEQGRVAAEKRRRALEARIRREEKRRSHIAARFRDLRDQLDEVRERQREVVRKGHEGDEKGLEREEKAALDAMRRGHEEEREALGEAAEAKLKDLEDALQLEYAARAAEERRIGEQYAAQLEAYWERRRQKQRDRKQRKNKGKGKGKGKEVPVRLGVNHNSEINNSNNNNNNINNNDNDGDNDDSENETENEEAKAQTRAALSDLQRRLDAGFEEWKRRADAELETCRYAAGEEVAIRAELMEEAERRLGLARRAGREALSRRLAAERRWVEVAVEEGSRVLGEMEEAELERDEVLTEEDVEAWFAEEEGGKGKGKGKGKGNGDGDGVSALDEYLEDYYVNARDGSGSGGGGGGSGGSSGTLTTEEMALGETAAWDQVDLREFVIPGAFIA